MTDKPKNVRLLVMPDGYTSHLYPVTVGKSYKVLDVMGCCLMIETDVAGETAIINRSRFEPCADGL